ncbi:MAG TPA: hypothetical protein VFE41_14520 [Acetobacteraceae bacterium]|jgi:hypothetical protein|nr:hypothetical protein [Acetobacteraceae bacterium]
MSGSTEGQDDTPDGAVTLLSPARLPCPPARFRPTRRSSGSRTRRSIAACAAAAPSARPAVGLGRTGVHAPRPQLAPEHVAVAHRPRWQSAARARCSATIAGYIEEGDLFEDNALTGVM